MEIVDFIKIVYLCYNKYIMPKEGTHQYIASRAQNLFVPKLGEAYFYGATAPDIFFFDFFKKPITSDRLHGKDGEATDQIFFNSCSLWSSLKESEQKILSDFLAGYVTHVITDRIFHPWVIYWSGGPEAEKKHGSFVHHYLETALDAAIASIRPKIKYNQKILNLYKLISKPDNNINRCARQHKFVTEHLDSWAFLSFSRNKPALLTLSYKFCEKYYQHYNLKDLNNWHHPVTGVVYNQSYQDLLQQAIDLSAHVLQQINWQKLADNDWATLIGPASLETNMVAVPFSDCRYQNTEYFKDFKPSL